MLDRAGRGSARANSVHQATSTTVTRCPIGRSRMVLGPSGAAPRIRRDVTGPVRAGLRTGWADGWSDWR